MKRKQKKQKISRMRRFLYPFIVSCTLTVGFFSALIYTKPAFAQTVLSQIRDMLVTKAGFTFLNDAKSDFLFYKQTDNYTAYAGEKGSAGGHRMRLTVDKYIFDFSFVDVSSVTLGVSTPSATPTATPAGDISDDARVALDRINKLIIDIDTQSASIDAIVKDAQTMAESIVPTAQLIETPAERMVRFEKVRPGTDIRYRLNEGGIKEEIVLNDPDHRYHQFIFSFDTHGLVHKDVGGGVWYFYDQNDTPIFRIPKGWAKDESGAFTNDVKVTIEKNLLLITVNEQWLYAKERVFPIIIDPTIEVIPEKRLTRNPGSNPFSDVAGAATQSAQPADPTPTEASSSGLRELFQRFIPRVHANESNSVGIDTHKGNLRIRAKQSTFKLQEPVSFEVFDTSQLTTKIIRFIKEKTSGKPFVFKDAVTVKLIDSHGQNVDGIVMNEAAGAVQVSVPPDLLKPGTYTLSITSEGNTVIQDFNWGVLAINPNKSIYKPDETADLSIAVLDEKGTMDCDAKLTLEITNPKSDTKKLSTADGSIQVNPACKIHGYTVDPDYEATYQLGPIGTYRLVLTAESKNGTYTIEDSVEVKDDAAFSIERKTATRINPVFSYPMEISITAKSDFRGTVTETVPENFSISRVRLDKQTSSVSAIPNSIQKRLTLSVTRVEGDKQAKVITRDGKQYIEWNGELKAGEGYNLSYQYRTPDISPAFYLLGPLTLVSTDKSVQFREPRQWQLAIDATSKLTPDADGTRGSWTAYTTSCAGTTNLYEEINDDPDSPNDSSDYVCGPNVVDGSMFVSVSDTPSDFRGADSLDLQARHRKSISVNDTTDIYYQIFQSDELTAIVNENGTLSSVLTASFANNTYTPTLVDATPGVGTNTKTNWDGARIRLRQDYTKVSNTDTTARVEVSGVEVNITYTPKITISGTIRQTNESTAYGCNADNLTIRVSVNGGANNTTTCTVVGGTYSIAVNQPGATTQPIVVFIDSAETPKGTTVTLPTSTTADIANLDIYQTRLIVTHEGGTALTNANLGTADTNGDSGIRYAVSSGNLTVETGIELHVKQSKTFDPGGTITTTSSGGDVHVDDSGHMDFDTSINVIAGNITVDTSAQLDFDASVDISGASLTCTGTCNASAGVQKFKAAGTVSGGGTINFYDLELNGTSFTTTLSSAATVDRGVVIGDTTTLKVNADLTVNTGKSATYGKMTTTGSTAAISTDSGTPTVTIYHSGTLGGGTGGITFYNLTLGDASTTATTTLSTSGMIVKNALIVTASQTFAMGTNSMTVGATAVAGSGDVTVNGATSQSTPGKVTILSSAAGTANFTGSGTFTVFDLDLGDAATTIIVDDDTSDLNLDVQGSINIKASATLQAPSSGTFKVAGGWTTGGTFTSGTGTVELYGTTSVNVVTGCATAGSCTNQDFNNLIINKTDEGVANDNVTLTTNHLTLQGLLTITDGELVQGTLNVWIGGASSVSIAAAGKWTNISTGDLTLGGSFANAGTATFQGNGVACGDNDDITITSTASVQRTWSGAGTFDINDATISWMTTSGITINTQSSFDAGNNNNTYWKFVGCTISISGTVKGTDESSGYNCLSDPLTLHVSINGAANVDGTCSASDGTFTISGISGPSSTGDPVAIFIDTGETPKGTTVTLASSTPTANITGLDIYRDRLIVAYETGNASITNAKLATADNGDGGILYGVSLGNLTVDSNIELHVWTGKTFAPGGNVTTQGTGDLHIDNNSVFTGATTQDHVITGSVSIDSGATLTAPSTEDDGTIRVGGNWSNNATGIFTSGSGKVIFTATSGTKTIDPQSDAFYDLTLGESSGTATWNLSSSLDVTGDLNITYGTLGMNGSNNISTIGTVAISSGGSFTESTGTWTFKPSGTKTLTDSSSAGPQDLGIVSISSGTSTPQISLGSNIKISKLTLASGHILYLGASSYTLEILGDGATATVFSNSGTVSPGTSTVKYSAVNSGGNVDVATAPYNNLELTGADTYVLTGSLTTTNHLTGNLTIGVGATLSTVSTYNLEVQGNWVNSGNFTANSATVTLDATTGSPTITSTSDAFYNLSVDNGGTSITWTLQDALDVNGSLLIDTSNTLDTGSNRQVNVAGNFTNNGTYAANSNTTYLDGAADTPQIIDGSTTFYNLTATGGDRIINFGSGDTFVIAASGTFTATGDSCTALVAIRSTLKGTAVNITKTGSISFSYVDAQDLNVNAAGATVGHSVDSGNNTNLTFTTNRDCISASTDATAIATGYSFQRKTFFDGTNHWTFNHDGDEIEIRYSTDGTSWSNPVTVGGADNGHLSYDTNDFSVWSATISTVKYVWLAVKNGNNIVVRRGTISATNIDWDSDVITALDGTTNAYSYPYITLDSSNYMWIIARNLVGSNYVMKAIRSDVNDTGDATWDTGIGFGTTVTEAQITNDQADTNVFGNIVALGSSDMYATMTVNTAIIGCRWDADDGTGRWETSNGTFACATTAGSGGSDTEGSSVRSSAGASKIDDAGDPGGMASIGRQIVQTSGGILYAFIYDSGSCEIWKSDNGSSWAEQDDTHNPSCSSGVMSMAIDNNDTIGLFYNNRTYNTFSTSTNLFGTEETAISTSDTIYFSTLTYDSNNKPHIVDFEDEFTGSDYNCNVMYYNKVGGSWTSAGVTGIGAQSSCEGKFTSVDIVINEDNIPEISLINAASSELGAAVGDQNNAISFTYQGVDTSISGSASIGIDSDGNTWITYTVSSYVTLAIHADAAAWTTWTVNISNSNIGITPSLSIIGKSIFVFYENDDATHQIAYDVYDSGTADWLGEQVLTSGSPAKLDAKVRYSTYNFHEPWLMDYLYSDGTDIYWNYVDLRPRKVDDASNFGSTAGLPGGGRQVVRTKTGVLYSFLNDEGNCEMWKSSDGVSWAQQQSGTSITCSTQYPVSAAVDNNQDIHVAYINGNSLKYRNYDTATDDWDTGGEGNIYTESFGDSGNLIRETVITIDASNIPHVAYKGSYVVEGQNRRYISYSNRIGGTWNVTPIEVENIFMQNDRGYVDITIDMDGKPEVSYYAQEDGFIVARGNANDATSFSTDKYTVDSTVNSSATSIAVDTLTGNTWASYKDSGGSIVLAKHAYGADWSTWTTDKTKTGTSYEPSIAIAENSQIYVFYQDNSTDQKIVYDVYDSTAVSPAWTGEVVLQTPGSGVDFRDVKAKWSFEWNNYGANRIDYLFSDGTDVYWDYLYLRRSPTNIDNASDFGVVPSEGRNVLRSSTGDLYSILNDGGNCEMWKSTDSGNSWTMPDSTSITCDSGDDVSAAIDSADTIHAIYQDGTALRYRTYSSNAWSGSATIYTTVSDMYYSAISIDSANEPHVVMSSDDRFGAYEVTYTNRISGLWKTRVRISSSPTNFFSNLQITLDSGDLPEISYKKNGAASLFAVIGNLNNATSFTSKTVDSSTNYTIDQEGNSIGIDSGGNTWISYVDETTNYITLYKHDYNTDWSTAGNWHKYTNSMVGYEPSIAIDGTDIYTFYTDDQDDIVYDKYNGSSWSGETLVEEHGALQDVKARWSYINNYDSTGVAPVQTNTFYFNDSTPYDDDTWSNDSNAFDSADTTYASTSTAGSSSTKYLQGDGTNATDQGSIVSVKARLYGGNVNTLGQVGGAAIYTSANESLGTATVSIPVDAEASWGSYTTLSVPTGGWSWTQIQNLYVRIYKSNGVVFDAGKVEILVESTNTTAQTEIDYLYSDGTDVFYNRVALAAASTPGTQDTIATTTNGTQYNFSTVSDSASPPDVHLLYVDNSSTKKIVYNRWDNNGDSSAWQTPVTIDETGSSTNLYPNLTLDSTSKDLYASWVDQTNDDHVYYRRCDVTTTSDECSTAEKWGTRTSKSTASGAVYNSLTANYSSAGKVFVIWTNTAATPFAVSWISILVVSGNNAPGDPTVIYINESATTAQSGAASPVVGVGDSTPVFSAQYNDADTGDIAEKYQVIVYSDSECTSIVWNSGDSGTAMTPCTQGNHCEDDFDYAGTALPLDGVKYYLKIRFWDDSGDAGTYSNCADNFTMVSPGDQLRHGNYFFNQSTERVYTW